MRRRYSSAQSRANRERTERAQGQHCLDLHSDVKLPFEVLNLEPEGKILFAKIVP
jgi:hypothetical protein